jgi:hypothetical protein
MSYDVVWGPIVEGMLARVWLAATDQSAVTVAAAELDALLADDPLHLGQPRDSFIRRIAFRPPLGIEFEVVEDDKPVIVQGAFTTTGS